MGCRLCGPFLTQEMCLPSLGSRLELQARNSVRYVLEIIALVQRKCNADKVYAL